MSAIKHSKQYFTYCIVGAVIGISAIAIRELLELILPSENPLYYGLSVVIVYAGGIVAGFFGHGKYTFSNIRDKDERIRSFVTFFLIAIFGMLLTVMLALAFLNVFDFRNLFRPAGPAIAFATAVLIVSAITYALNARYTFRYASRSDPDSNQQHTLSSDDP